MRVAVIVPSAEGLKFVAPVPPTQSEAGPLLSPHLVGVSEVPLVAATSVSSSSTLIGVAAAAPSKLIPHSMMTMFLVEGVAICSSVFIAVPVATGTCAAVVGDAPFAAKNRFAI